MSMDAKRADRIAQRLQRALQRGANKSGKLRLSIRRVELEQLHALAVLYAKDYRDKTKRDALIGPGDAMRVLKVSRRGLEHLVTSGKLACVVRPSGHRRFVLGSVQACAG